MGWTLPCCLDSRDINIHVKVRDTNAHLGEQIAEDRYMQSIEMTFCCPIVSEDLAGMNGRASTCSARLLIARVDILSTLPRHVCPL